MNAQHTSKPFTGKHMAAILIAGFGVVIAVNFTMAGLASSTFGGIVVENSYVASQEFNRWLDEADREKALGWKLAASRRADGRVAARLGGVPRYATITAEARHPLGRVGDVRLVFVRDAAGAYVSDKPLPAGRWTLRFDIEAEGKTWRGERAIS
ncbi:Nitrogen fixation protein FixH [Novosphingobium sp. CF614]|uniref:FixH family protein n=1 Tax=Novosphingobium sp. CF614 TaxID=1884364 RepID=UPI0008E86395|nr:FixH family protein [Novosphingobium sp. CF614]SFF90821.1 Nitrogen fixation protein FixH [Novosphingobium sp. CF614]